jgi:cytochrome d ubiquinol oxidase subunit II
MPAPATFAALTILAALILYSLSGGADYGGGVWDLLASGPRARQQRELIAHAIAPIWEANHVWLILAIVVLFTAFPPAFAAISTSLHIPLAMALIGIVLRGSAFAFRAYDPKPGATTILWQRVFAISSLVTPFLLGVSAGAIAAGRVQPSYGFIQPWFSPLPILVGVFSVALFAYLAAVYLTVENTSAELREDFRKRAMAAWMVVGAVALIGLRMWHGQQPVVELRGLAESLETVTAVCALAAFGALWARKLVWARTFAALEVALILAGWGATQFPYLVVPLHTISNAAAPLPTLRALEATLMIGAVVLFPSFAYLYGIFKKPRVL